jgi:hypothetical protein
MLPPFTLVPPVPLVPLVLLVPHQLAPCVGARTSYPTAAIAWISIWYP